MLAVLSPPDTRPHPWVEIKWDGYRCVAYVSQGTTRLFSRRGRDLGHAFPELTELHRDVNLTEAVLDGEIVAFEGDRPSFHRLQARLGLERSPNRESGDVPVAFVAFDLLERNRAPVLDRPLAERRRMLEDCVQPGDRLQLSPVFHGVPADLLVRSAALHLEGIVVKNPESPYVPGRRTSYWRKMKQPRELIARIVGFTARGGSLRSLLLARPDEGGRLVYVGRVGTGLSERELAIWQRRLEPLVRVRPPLAELPADAPSDAVWVEPVFACRVAYSEMTPLGRLRHPVYRGIEEGGPDPDSRSEQAER